MKNAVVCSLALAWAISAVADAQEWSLQPLPIQTRWTRLVSPSNALPEYPRPQMVRSEWQNLNGLWSYSITAKGAPLPTRYSGGILVPYPLESALSGVKKSLAPDQLLWYRRTIAVKHERPGDRTLLHFGAVDYQATVYLNGQEVGAHSGGYQSFTMDITDALKTGDNELVVRVYDPTDKGPNPHGKQTLRPEGIFYTATSGIWRTVWLESVPRTYIESLTMIPDVDHSQLRLDAHLKGEREGTTVEAIARSGATIVAKGTASSAITLHIEQPRLWSPDDPYLYDLEVRVLKDGEVVDDVKSYFGLRKIEVKKNAAGVEQIFLNNLYTFNLGVLDQGFWPDGVYTAPTDAALKFDIQAIKAMGFNTIRKHIKIEPERWYYYCDKLGMLVWQDMVPPADGTRFARAEFEKEIQENIAQLSNHPSIITWVLFNEGWGGSYDYARLAQWVKHLDGSRLVNSHSGPNVQGDMDRWLKHPEENLENWAGGDMTDIHAYPHPKLPPADPGKARVVGEHGGIGVYIDEHVWNDLAGFGYAQVAPDQTTKSYEGLVDELKGLEMQGLTGSIYTQITDVEGELNGLMTYDRAIIKMPAAEVASINAKLVPKAGNYEAATRGFFISLPDLSPEAERYKALLAEYRKGRRDLSFLRHLALMAIRQKDQSIATEAGNEFITRSAQPYSKETWGSITAITRTSNDKGFALLRAHAVEVDKVLGENTAEEVIREIIGREQ